MVFLVYFGIDRTTLVATTGIWFQYKAFFLWEFPLHWNDDVLKYKAA